MKTKMKKEIGGVNYYPESTVRTLIQNIYSEFMELPTEQKVGFSLKEIIEQEVEKHPLCPIKIFK